MKGSEDQAVDVPFIGGMGEGTAPFTLNVPFVELAEDCVITKEGAYQRIPGGSIPAILTSVTGGTRGLSVFDSTLVQHTTSGPQQYNETASTWRASNPKGFVPTQAKSDLLVAQSGRTVYNTQRAASSAGYELYLWDETYPQLENNAYSGYGVGFVAKGLALRDPSGGWLIPPTTTNLGTCPGHQIIAVGQTFLIAFATVSGFQVYKIAQTATALSALVQIVTSAVGSAVAVSASTTMTSVHDCCLSTSGTSAYFLVGQYSGSVNYYVYTVSTAGQVGSASTGAWVAFSSGAICVDNSKVYVARTESSGANVYLSKFSEAVITTGIPATIIGNFTTTSNLSAYRIRIAGKANTGVVCALESYVAAPSTTASFAAYPPATTPSYKQLPSAPYVEVGFLPTSDVIGDYSSTTSRAYAHGYTLKSGLETTSGQRVQLLVAYNGLSQLARAYVGGDMESDDGLTTANFGIWDQVEASGPYYGGIWLEVLSQQVVSEQGTITNLSFRSLARVCWDSLYSDHRIDTSPAVGIYNKREAICYIRGSLSRSVGLCLAAEGIIDTETHGLRRIEIDNEPKPPLSVVAHGDLFFDGSCQHVWDGQHSFENTPHFPPIVAWVPELPTGLIAGDSKFIEAPPVSITSCPFGYTDTYSFYWEWVDGSGYLHRSGVASLYLRVTGPLSEGGCYHYSFAIPGYFAVLPPLSANDATTFRNLRLVVSMLPGTGSTSRSTLYSKWAKTWEGTAAAFVTMRISERIASTPTVGYLYTDGGVLEAQASPSPVSITSTRDRLWLISADNRRQLYYSKPLEQLTAPEFNSAFTVDIPADAGEGVVVLTVDDKPVVLCERGLYVIAGDGPNALGLQGDFVPQVVQSDTGCLDKNSTAKCDYGAFFQGERGIYLLDRGLNVSLVSQGVQDKAQGDISKAVAVPKEQQVRFGLSNSGVLVYHYALKAWTYLNKTAYDAVIWDDAYTRVWDAATYRIISSDGTTLIDDEGVNNMRIKTCWIKADKMQGFSRFKRVLLLHNQQGIIPTDYGPITVNIYFNYEEDPEDGSYVETSTISSANRKPVAVRSQVDVRIGRQKVESIKIDVQCPNRFSQGDFVEFYAPIAMEGLCLVVGTITNTQFRHLRKQTKS